MVAFPAAGAADSRPVITVDPFLVDRSIVSERKTDKGIDFAVSFSVSFHRAEPAVFYVSQQRLYSSVLMSLPFLYSSLFVVFPLASK